jgi:hypothetical protein
MQRFLILLFTVGLVFADPSPLGLELGKATLEQAKSKYKLLYSGTNKYTLGPMFEIPTSQVDIDGVSGILLVFDRKGILQVVLMKFPKNKWGEIYNALRRKYKLVDSKIPFVGDKYAEFVDGNTVIVLNAPHLSFTMSLIYARKEFIETMRRVEEQEEKEKQKRLEREL